MPTKSESKKLTKKDLMSLFWRAFLLPACYSMDRMQAPGFAYSIIPVLKKLYGNDKDELNDGSKAGVIETFCYGFGKNAWTIANGNRHRRCVD